jgi:hypothetical protein
MTEYTLKLVSTDDLMCMALVPKPVLLRVVVPGPIVGYTAKM